MPMEYVALILAGGEGTRLKPLTLKIPKPAIPLVNKPFLFYQLDLINEAGIRDVFILSGYKSNILKKIFKKNYKNLRINFIEEKNPLGTGGAIGFAKDIIKRSAFVFNGDVLFFVNLLDILKKHKERGAMGTLMAIKVEDPSRYGVILSKKNGKIIKFLEKTKNPPTNWINGGLYLFEWEILKEIPENKASIEKEIFPNLIEKNFYLNIYKYRGYWKDIGTIESFKEATFDLLKGKIKFWERETKENKIKIKVEDFFLDCHSTIGEKCKIGKGTKIKKSIIFEGAEIGKNCQIIDSIIFSKVKLPNNSLVKEEVIVEN